MNWPIGRRRCPAIRTAARYETPETEQAILDQAAKPADRLGIEWLDDAALAGGIKVSAVEPDSPADRAGLRAGRSHRTISPAGKSTATTISLPPSAAADSPASLTVNRPGTEKPLDVKVALLGSPLRWGILWRVDDAEPGTVILTHVVPGSPAARAGLARRRPHLPGRRPRLRRRSSAFARLVEGTTLTRYNCSWSATAGCVR